MAGSVWVLLLALVLFGTTLLMHRFIDGQLSVVRLPITWFYASWLVGLLLLALPLYTYFEEFNASSASYVIGILFSYSFGSIAAAFWNRRVQPTAVERSESQRDVQKPLTRRLIYSLLIMGALGTTLLMVNTILSGGLSLADRLDSDNLAAIRSAHMTTQESRIGPLFGPATMMSSIGGLGVAFVFYLRGARDAALADKKWLYRLTMLVLINNIVIGFIGFGSRMFAVFAVLIGFLAFVEGRWSIGERLIVKRLTFKHLAVVTVSAVATLAILWVSATVFLEKRVQAQDPKSLLYRTHRASFSPFVYDLTRGDQTAQYFMFSLSYFSTPIPTLAFYLDLPEGRQPGPFFGEYNFPALGRWVRRLTFNGDPFFWDRERFEIFKPLGDIQFGMNVWSTLVRDLIADFTKAGALAFLTVMAFFSQRTFDLQLKNPTARRAGLLVYLRLVLVFSGLISIFFQPQIHWPLFLVMLLLAFSRRKGRRNVPELRLPVRSATASAGFSLNRGNAK